MGVFSKDNVPDVNINRNAFDLSFQNNLTMRFGSLYPCFCKEAVPGDSFKIDAAFGLRFLPLAFPVQTKMRCDVHFFYVRLRNLWKDFQDFYGNNSLSVTAPYLSKRQMRKLFRTGSLGDYLGLPSTCVGGSVFQKSYVGVQFQYPQLTLSISPQSFDTSEYDVTSDSVPRYYHYQNKSNDSSFGIFDLLDLAGKTVLRGQSVVVDVSIALDGSLQDFPHEYTEYGAFLVEDKNPTAGAYDIHSVYPFRVGSAEYLTTIHQGTADEQHVIRFVFIATDNITFASSQDVLPSVVLCLNRPQHSLHTDRLIYAVRDLRIRDNAVFEASDSVDVGDFKFKVSSLPFRAYESIYNSFYRDDRNNPLLVNGQVSPNTYLRRTDGGEDDLDYPIYNRNWEQDFLTTALPSPQQGAAPLVGLTSTGTATYLSDDGVSYNVKLTTADDGDTITGATYQSNIPGDVARSIVNIASSGISINDLRAVNSLQRWLETNVRRGLKYKDQLLSHFGVHAKYDVLDMPEFIGGFSEFVSVNQVNQTSEGTPDNPLGSFAGQASAVGSSRNSVSVYCDEPGFIMGIVSVVPVPCYSQLLPKMFLKNKTLDYFFPEFGHIGMQPIPYSEVCPTQCLVQGMDTSRTFGYQRAWYDYLSSVDEVHGDFRKPPFSDFLLQRMFRSLPSLTPEFLTISDSQLNDIFTVNESEDKILGQIHFNVVAKRPIPRYGIPKLE